MRSKIILLIISVLCILSSCGGTEYTTVYRVQNCKNERNAVLGIRFEMDESKKEFTLLLYDDNYGNDSISTYGLIVPKVKDITQRRFKMTYNFDSDSVFIPRTSLREFKNMRLPPRTVVVDGRMTDRRGYANPPGENVYIYFYLTRENGNNERLHSDISVTDSCFTLPELYIIDR